MDFVDSNKSQRLEQTITTFNEAVPEHKQGNVSNVKLYNTMPRVQLDTFLKRPIPIANVNWATSSNIGADLGEWRFPDVLYDTSLTFKNKLLNSAFWKPDIEISIRINGTPMHYGRLCFTWIPQASNLNLAYKNFRNAWSNQWYQVSANGTETTTFIVPFTHFKDVINIGKQNVDLFTLYCYVAVPLTSLTGSAQNIGLTIFARVIEPQLYGYNYKNDFVAQSDEAEEKTKQGNVISSTLHSASSIASKLSVLPVIGELATPVSVGLGSLATVLEWFGLGIPTNVGLTKPVQIRQPRLLQYEDCPTTLTLGPKAELNIDKDYEYVNDSMDNVTILNFIQRPALLTTVRANATMTPGTNVFGHYLNPELMYYTDYAHTYDQNNYVGLPMEFMSRFFNMWRGSIRFHVNFVCSHFHSARFRIYYIPYISGIDIDGVQLSEIESNDVVNIVVDINKETEVSFTIPYMQMTDWLDVRTFNVNNATIHNGFLGIQLINEITAGTTESNPIYIQVFASAGSDFQFNMAENKTVEKGVFKAQSDFYISNPCEYPSSSMKCLMSVNYPPLGNMAHVGHISYKDRSPTLFTSIKQLTNMVSGLLNFQAGSFTGYTVCLHGDLQLGNNYTTNNYLVNMMSVFRYWRGGTRVIILNNDHEAIVEVHCDYRDSTDLTTTLAPYDAFSSTTGEGSNLTYALAHFNHTGSNPCDVVIPWNCKYKCLYMRNHEDTTLQETKFLVSGFRVKSAANLRSMLCVGGADDFILGFQLGIPSSFVPV